MIFVARYKWLSISRWNKQLIRFHSKVYKYNPSKAHFLSSYAYNKNCFPKYKWLFWENLAHRLGHSQWYAWSIDKQFQVKQTDLLLMPRNDVGYLKIAMIICQRKLSFHISKHSIRELSTFSKSPYRESNKTALFGWFQNSIWLTAGCCELIVNPLFIIIGSNSVRLSTGDWSQLCQWDCPLETAWSQLCTEDWVPIYYSYQWQWTI